MANIQDTLSSEASRPPDLKTSSIKAPHYFNGTQPFKLRIVIQFLQLIFHNDKENFSNNKKKFIYSTSFVIGRAAKLIEPYFSNLTDQDPRQHLNNWELFESKLCTLFGDPNEVRKAKVEVDG
ncbi:hypothetical protein O181_094266 [Austropuccinia psidii MF-1]|uniref:Uncharacterized protein n=1 Tax=Austropuccinia psidii MF-1 TaxID=1389203 RepID=A0A9Q3J336_9BASI|nr:hypothetical protein [Austropuccinia psidii MF-1]